MRVDSHFLVYCIAIRDRLDTVVGKFAEKQKVVSWLQTFGAMKASDELDDDQVRQLIFDIENCYNAFNDKLNAGGT